MSAMRAMVVDDSRAMRKILGRILNEIGFDVVEAGDGMEGLQMLRDDSEICVALVDINMPNMNGIDMVREVRSNMIWDDLRLLMVTSETEMSAMVDALEAGANEYATKPFDSMVILEKLRMMGVGDE
jgi:two-component system chemotaxis response regulator CheY